MWGKTTTSRRGTMGNVSITSILSLSRPNMLNEAPPEGREALLPAASTHLLDESDRLFPVEDHVARHHALLDLLHRGEVVHELQHEVFDDHPQAAGADLARDREV